MEHDACDLVAYDAFSLAVRVMYEVYGIEEPGTEFERPWSLLREIAEGRTTLANPADTAAKFPAMREFLFERANRMVDDDRRTAMRVLRGLAQAFGSSSLEEER